jgi:LPS-assembly protein
MVRIIAFLLFTWILTATNGSAQNLPGIETSRQMRLEQLDANHMQLTGLVEIDGDGWQFYADQVDLFTDESRLVATGNVVFTAVEGGRVAAERVEFDTEALTGVFYNATGSTPLLEEDIEPSMFGTQEAEMQFWGEVIEKIGPRTYRLTRGGFTSCVQPTPRWHMTASSVTINLDEYAVMRNSVLSVKGVPFFYLPILYYPIQTEGRATGFLMPTYGASSIRGPSLSNAFFWAIGRSQDATVFHDLFTSTGQALGSEYRYVGNAGRGNFTSYFLDERENTYPNAYSGNDFVVPARRSYNLTGDIRHSLTDSISARGRVNYFSDVAVQQMYQTNIFQATNSSRAYGGALSGSWGAYSVSGSVDMTETFLGPKNSARYGSTPRINFARSEQQLVGPVYFGLNSEFGNLIGTSNWYQLGIVEEGLVRYNINPTFRVPLTALPFLTINSSASFSHTGWSQSIDPNTNEQVAMPINRNLLDMETEIIGPVFVKVWDTPGTNYAERMKHVVEPWVSVRRTTAVDNFDQIVQLDYTDAIVGNVTQFRYGLTNRIFARRSEDSEAANAQEILTVSLQQSYYSDDNAAQWDSAYQSSFGFGNRSNFSPMSLSVRAALTRELSGIFRAEYDTDYMAFRTIGTSANIDVGGWFSQNAGLSQRRYVQRLTGFNHPSFLTNYLNSFTNVRTRDNTLGGVYSFNFDLTLNRFLQQRVLAYYNAQCCGFSIEYQEYNLSGIGFFTPVPVDRRFNLSFTLAGLGTFSNMLGAFGIGTGAAQY